jgi:hypothetical protein
MKDGGTIPPGQHGIPAPLPDCEYDDWLNDGSERDGDALCDTERNDPDESEWLEEDEEWLEEEWLEEAWLEEEEDRQSMAGSWKAVTMTRTAA